VGRLDARLELRLDRQMYERLERRATADHVTVAQLVRQAIARELAGDERSWREQALERGLSLQVPVPDDPADLVRELEVGYEPWGLGCEPAEIPPSGLKTTSRPGHGRPDRG
jgi:hypothetical protein